MKKRILSLIIALLAVVVLVGCKKTTKKNDGSTYDITVWCGESVVELTKQQIAEYNKTAEYKFNANVVAVSEAKAGATVLESVENAADLYCFAQDQLATLVEGAAISKLGQAAATFVSENNDAGSTSAAKVGADTYAYPLSSDNGYFLFYDKRYVSDEQAKTIEGILAACEAANRKFSFNVGKDGAWYAASYFFSQGLYSEWHTNDDGTFAEAADNWNSEKGQIALKGMHQLVTNPKWVDSAANDFTSKDDEPTASAAVVSGTWISSTVSDTLGANMGVTKLPTYTVDGQTYQLGSFAGFKLMGVKPQSDARKQAELHKLAQYLSGETCQTQRFEAVQWGPSNKVAQATDAVKANKPLAALAQQSQFATPQGQFPNAWWQIVMTFAESVNTENPDYAQILADYQTAIDALANTDGEPKWDVDFTQHTWGLTGTFGGHNWGGEETDVDTALVKTEGKMEWKSDVITLAEGDAVKVRADNDWAINIGKDNKRGGGNFEVGEGKDIEPGDYVVVMTVNDHSVPTITFVSQHMEYGVIGLNGDWDHDVMMTESETTPGTFTAEVTFNADGGLNFKIRGNGSWDSGVNLGVTSDDDPTIINGGNSGNIKVPAAGTYVITLVVGADDTYTITATPKA